MGRGAGCPVSPDDANDITITLGVVIGPRMAPITVLTVVVSSLIDYQTTQLSVLNGLEICTEVKWEVVGRKVIEARARTRDSVWEDFGGCL